MGGVSDEELLEKDLYEILGISSKATEDEIRNAYKKKARRLHPDKCKEPNAHENFVILTAARDALLHPLFRERYDIYWLNKEFEDTFSHIPPKTPRTPNNPQNNFTRQQSHHRNNSSKSESDIRIMQLQAEIERLQGELDAKTALFEDKFRTQQCLITDNELKLLKSEEANKKFEQQVTFLENLNRDLSTSHAELKDHNEQLTRENQELKSKLSWLMTGNESLSENSKPAESAPEIFSDIPDRIIKTSSSEHLSSLNTSDTESEDQEFQPTKRKIAVALWDFQAENENELSLPAGATITDIVEVNSEWWSGTLDSFHGIFPAAYVKLSD